MASLVADCVVPLRHPLLALRAGGRGHRAAVLTGYGLTAAYLGARLAQHFAR